MQLRAFAGCCGVSEMWPVRSHPVPNESTYTTIRTILDAMVLPTTLKVGSKRHVVVFTDNQVVPVVLNEERSGYVAGTTTPGDAWQKFLIDKGFRVDKFSLGNGNHGTPIYIYHWYPYDDGAKLSMVREYNYNDKQEAPVAATEPGTTTGARAKPDGVVRKRRRVGGISKSILKRIRVQRGA